MINDEEILAGLVAFLKARKTTLSAAVEVIGRGDTVPDEGASLHVSGFVTPVTGPLHYAEIDLTAEVPALESEAAATLRAATGFIIAALPADQTQKAALHSAIQTATGNKVTVHYYHHAAPQPADGDEDTYARAKHLRIAIQRTA
ncbi:MAG TPA: hypothetical protein PLA50_02700 [Bacteroidia bacterium]|nr:hypothetical protein [Bacteroidia bacterium]